MVGAGPLAKVPVDAIRLGAIARQPGARQPGARQPGTRQPGARQPGIGLGSPLRGVMRLAAFLALTLILIPVQLAALVLKSPLAERLPVRYHRLSCLIFGLKVERMGAVSTARPTLFVCNHASYIDILVLSGLAPISFVAKSEVAAWPFFGLLAKLQRTVFVDRQRRSTAQQRDGVTARLKAGDNIMLFPEGTSDDGNRLRPFFSALLSAAEERGDDGRPVTVQPVSLAYTRLDGAPLGHGLRPLVAWYGDMELPAHLWHFACLGHVTAEVQFHRPVSIDDFGSRKDLSRHCEDTVAGGLAAALAGRPPAC
jgi:1-acyl-sn-glycerol-3-phosphate acyltransferase